MPNELLTALPEEDRQRLSAYLEPIELSLGEVLYEPGQIQTFAYFPTSAVVSKLYVTETGGTGAIALVGNDGLVGFSLFLGGRTAPTRAVVQSAGSAYRIKGDTLRREFVKIGVLQQLMLRYTEALLIQIGQTVICSRHHTIQQQLCRWLLMIMDRVASNELVMTHELIARMLGVRREGVTEAATRLKRARVIHYTRGCIEIINRPRMEALSCDCYHAVRNEQARLMPWSHVATDRNRGEREAKTPSQVMPLRQIAAISD
ncbi:MAG: Crp/Fnr family transcriptional regulator [Rhodanobacteraceae bacterium]